MPRPLAPNDINTLSQQRERRDSSWYPPSPQSKPFPLSLQPVVDEFAINFGTPRFLSNPDDARSSSSRGNTNSTRFVVPVNLPRMLPRHEDEMTDDRLVFLDSRLRITYVAEVQRVLAERKGLSVIRSCVFSSRSTC